MLNITINQALNFWNQLVKCYYNNSYGGDSTEIYTYTMMPHSPFYANNPDIYEEWLHMEGLYETDSR